MAHWGVLSYLKGQASCCHKKLGLRVARCSDYSTEARHLDFLGKIFCILKCMQIVSAGCIQPQSHRFGILPSVSTEPAKSSEPIPVKIVIIITAISKCWNSVIELLLQTETSYLQASDFGVQSKTIP